VVLTDRMEGDRPLDDLADPAVGTTPSHSVGKAVTNLESPS
jgi:hypothetical protein